MVVLKVVMNISFHHLIPANDSSKTSCVVLSSLMSTIGSLAHAGKDKLGQHLILWTFAQNTGPLPKKFTNGQNSVNTLTCTDWEFSPPLGATICCLSYLHVGSLLNWFEHLPETFHLEHCYWLPQNHVNSGYNRGFHKHTALAIVALLPFVCSHTFAVSFFIPIILY